MSDSGSLGSVSSSSSCTSLGMEPRETSSRRLQTRTPSECSTSEAGGEDTPSRESISAALDKYVLASKDGREAFNSGNLSEAVKEFDQALDIELQTELECLYDTSIGFVSGLVRREVDSRLDKSVNGGPGDSAHGRYSRILQQLREAYQQAADGVKGKKNDSPQWYLQMGAALVVINEWEKAKAIYTEGINVCKDKKMIKVALKNLIKTEQMTSYAEIPAEDQPEAENTPTYQSPLQSPSHSPRLSPAPRSPHLSPARSSPAPHSPRSSPAPRSPHLSPAPRSPRLPLHPSKRHRSGSVGLALSQLKKEDKRARTASFSSDHSSNCNGAVKTNAVTPPVNRRDTSKRLSFNIFKRSSVGLMYKSASITSPEEVEMWSDCFNPFNCRVIGHNEFQPSAITHMRRLTSVGGEEDEVETTQDSTKLYSSSFVAVKLQSMRIEDDDSDIED